VIFLCRRRIVPGYIPATRLWITEEALASGTAIYDDFAASDWPGEKWYRHLPAPDIWDPVTRVTCGGGSLAVEAKPFTLSCRNAHDNVKALIYSTAEFTPGNAAC
jgi:hypothetical protein